MSKRKILFVALIAAAAGCGDGSGDGDKGGADGGADADADGDTDTGTGTDDEKDCAGVKEKAQNGLSPVDIVIAVDSSGSMTEEASFVQENMNAFSEQIMASGVNAHIVLVSIGSLDGNGICVEPPLGNGSCPDDSNLPTYHHLRNEVDSENSLFVIQSTYGTWKDDLRVNSVRHVVVVSDDNSMLPFWTAQWFITQMSKKNPPFDDFTFHAIVSLMEPDVACAQDPPHPCCGLAAARGTVYEALVEKTGGVVADLCEQDFQPVFDELAEVMADVPIACEWELPPPPKGQVLDPEKVNVEFTDGDGVTHGIGYVSSFDDCAGVEHGWYYDDEALPTKIYVCPQTCHWIQADLDASIAITFGCNRKPAEPV